MKIACIGGGPAGLYLGILIKRSAPEHEVVIFERNRAAETFGFGVVFSDATLGHLAVADPETHAQITAKFARWDDIEIHVANEVLRSTGHGFCGLERKTLLQILQARAQALGVVVHYEREVRDLAAPELAGVDVVVAADGAASWVREARADAFVPDVDVRPNRFVWLGCTVPYTAFTFLFEDTPFGLFRVHAYRYHAEGSTFIVECRDETWRAAGLAEDGGRDEDRTIRILGEIFAGHLGSHRLVKNRSIWRSFPTVRCAAWHADRVVLVGDAAHTAHFSIGSGTKLAMEDSIALAEELIASPRDVGRALAAYEARRRPEVEALQAAAQASLEWFEGTERYLRMPPVQFTYSLMTRSQRVSHASVGKRDPHLARGVEQLLVAASGGARPGARAGDRARRDSAFAAHAALSMLGAPGSPMPPLPRPATLPFALGDRTARSRIAIAPEVPATSTASEPTSAISTISATSTTHDLTSTTDATSATSTTHDPTSATSATSMTSMTEATSELTSAGWYDDLLVALGGAAASGVGLVVTPLLAAAALATDDAAVAWRRIIDYVHRAGALIALRLAAPVADAAFAAAIERAVFADFDVLVLDPPADDAAAIEALPALVARTKPAWRAGGKLAAAVHDHPKTRAVVVGQAAQLVRAGADLLWVSSRDRDGAGKARIPAAPLADRLRNELGVATAVVAGSAVLSYLDAAIAAGRADLVVVDRLPAELTTR